MKLSGLIGSLLLLIILGGCGANQRNAYVYPYGISANEDTRIIQNNFSSLETCREFALSQDKGSDNFDYECGYKCKYNSSMGLNVCKETRE